MAEARPSSSMVSLLRERDRALYAACLYVPDDKREAVAALHLFELETRSIRALISEPMPGEIRLQWWRDVITGQRDGEARSHPLAAGLLSAQESYGLSPQLLERLADARIFDLYDDPMPSIADFEAYCGQTWSTTLQLCLHVVCEGQMDISGDAAGHAGCAMGVAWVLQNLPIHTRRGQCFAPSDLLQAVGLSHSELFETADSAQRTALVDALVSLGEAHLADARRHLREVPKAGRVVYLPLVGAELIMQRARRLEGKVFAEPLNIPPLRYQVALLKNALLTRRRVGK